MRTIICTTGTSISGGKARYTDTEGAEPYRRAIRTRIEEMRGQAGAGFLDAVSAETKSLAALKSEAADAVVFLHTDTPDGRICAELVAEVLERGRGIRVQLKCIAGLQVGDENVFRREGIDHLFGALSELTAGKDYDPDAEVVLNVTGGFKSVVPYVTLFGLLKRFDIAYIHEGSSRLIRLPPLPVQYDFERIGQAAEAIRQLRAEKIMKREAFFALIPGLDFHDRRLYECLVEEAGDDVALSALADHLLCAREEERLAVMIHPNARKSLERWAGTLAAAQFGFMLERVSDPLWRNIKRHRFNGTDLAVYKPGDTAERIAGFIQGRTFFACELFGDHAEYDRDLPNCRCSMYRTADFVPWTAPSGVESAPETEEQLFAVLQEKATAAQQDAASALEMAEESELRLVAAQNELEAERLSSRKREETLDALLTEANQELERLRIAEPQAGAPTAEPLEAVAEPPQILTPRRLEALVAVLKDAATPKGPALLTHQQRWHWLMDTLLGQPLLRGGQRPVDGPGDPLARAAVACANELRAATLGPWEHLSGTGAEAGPTLGAWFHAFAVLVAGILAQEPAKVREAVAHEATLWTLWQLLRATADGTKDFQQVLAALELDGEAAGPLAAVEPATGALLEHCPLDGGTRIGTAAVAARLAVGGGPGLETAFLDDPVRQATIEELLNKPFWLVTLTAQGSQAALEQALFSGAAGGQGSWFAQVPALARELLLDPPAALEREVPELFLLGEQHGLPTLVCFERPRCRKLGKQLERSLRRLWSGKRLAKKHRQPRLMAMLEALAHAEGTRPDLGDCLARLTLSRSPELSLGGPRLPGGA